MTRFVFAALTILAVPELLRAQPANDDCAAATVIAALPFTDAVDTTAATTELGDPDFECEYHGGGQGERSVWYRYTSAAGGSIDVDTFGSDYDTFIAAWRGTCGALGPPAACNEDDHDQNSPAVSGESRLFVTLTPGETIYLEVMRSPSGSGGNLVLNVAETTAFRVTDEDIYTGERPDVASGADGTFMIVWEQDEYTIMGRRYCDSGVPMGPAFQISESTGYGMIPKVARAGSDFVVVWYEGNVRGRRVSGGGTPLGSAFDVSDGYPDSYHFAVGGDASGGFVVTWADFFTGRQEEVVARRFDASGTPLGAEFAVNTYTTGTQRRPEVASDPAGKAVIVWESDDQDGGNYGVFGRHFDAAGAPLGGEFQVNVATTYRQAYPVVATDPSGSFVVAWHDQSYANCSTYLCVVGRRYDATASPLGGEFVVSPPGTEPPSFYVWIDAGRSDDGDFIVSWADEFTYPRARAFDADGTPQGAPLQLNFENDYQREVRLGVAGDGDFQVVWDWAPIGSSYKIIGRAVANAPSCPAPTGCPASPRTGCKQPTLALKGNLTLKNQSPDSRDAIIWKWVKGEATTVAEVGNPLASDSYTLCLYDGNGLLQVEAEIPAAGTCSGSPCWKDLSGTGFKYADKIGAEGDVRKLLVKSGVQGRAKVVAKAQGAGVAVPTLPPVLPLRAQLSSSTGTCWEAEFESAGVTKSTPTVFGAKPSL